MAKYDALQQHLVECHPHEVVLTFEEIENILGSKLPKGATLPQFWANSVDRSGHVQREAWRGARYNAFLVADEDRVRFVPLSAEPNRGTAHA